MGDLRLTRTWERMQGSGLGAHLAESTAAFVKVSGVFYSELAGSFSQLAGKSGRAAQPVPGHDLVLLPPSCASSPCQGWGWQGAGQAPTGSVPSSVALWGGTEALSLVATQLRGSPGLWLAQSRPRKAGKLRGNEVQSVEQM